MGFTLKEYFRHLQKKSIRQGQAMLESIIVLFFLCLIFFAVYEYTHLLTAKTVLDYAAARAVRARTVGFNDFMITKTVRVATMSMAGECLTHDEKNEDLSTGTLVSRMGSYLECENEADTKGILDFDLWDNSSLGWSCSEPGGTASELSLQVWQKRPLYGNADDTESRDNTTRIYTLTGKAEIEGHYPFYLQ